MASVSSLGKTLKRASSAPFLWRMDRSLWNGPAFLRIESHPAKGIGHHVAIDRLRRMTCPPADDVTAAVPLWLRIFQSALHFREVLV